jgi:SWI/SNF-related matrix-associated actin-dependent regulator 1 of chromatin subfamily A
LHALDARGLLFGNNKNGMSYNEYTKRYCNAHRTRFGYDVKGISNAEELHTCLKSVMIRRLKSDVLQDLPSKQRTIIPVSIMDVEKERESRETMMQLRNARQAVAEITDLDADDVANSAQWEARKLLMQGMSLLQSYSTDIKLSQ